MRRAIFLLIGVTLALPAAASAATTQDRSDPDDSPGATAADLRGVAWSLDGGTASLTVRMRDQGTTGQRVLTWLDTNADGAADLVARIDRDNKATAAAAVEPVTGAVAPCQPAAGGKAIMSNAAVPVVVDGDTMSVKLTFPLDAQRFRWAAYGESTTDPAPFDYLPDGAAVADRLCGGQNRRADLTKGAHFPDSPPVAAFETDHVLPLADQPFTAKSTSTDPDGTIVDTRWELGAGDAFDDGTGAELPLKLPAGDQVIGLKVTDDDGLTTIVRKTITVSSTALSFPLQGLEIFTERPLFVPDGLQPPQGHALDNGNAAPKLSVRVRRAGRAVALDASASRDDGKIMAFDWDLDGDGIPGDARGPRVKALFDHPMSILLVATDDKGLEQRLTVRVPGSRLPRVDVAAALRRARHAAAPAGAFEHGLGGWTRLGHAFAVRRKPTLSAAVDLRTASRLGGSYAEVPLPVGAAGRGWVSSATLVRGTRGLSRDDRADAATGALVSPSFPVTKRYLTLRVGGHGDGKGERVEVWTQRSGRAPRRVKTILAGDDERLRNVVVDLKKARGARATVVAVDASAAGHVNMDAVTLGPVPVLPPPPPIVGFADTHTHPDAHQSFGGLQGHRTYMGVPGGRYADYLGATGADMYAHDIKDINTHLAGTFALRVLIGLIHELAPDMAQGLHEQMHITEVHRAWEGGLRLMSSLAMSNQAMEHMTGKIIDRDTGGDPCVDLGGLCMRDGRVRATIRTTPDRQVIAAHVLAMRELARLNADWMEIAYDPEDAYRIMAEGKLAVVLGTEVDSLGSLGFPTAEDEVDWLWGLGVRQLTPVHAIDNAIGGAVAFQDLYDTTEDLVNRPERDARRDTIQDELHRDGVRIWNPAARFGAFMKVENYGCHFAIGGVVAPPGECVDWRYDDEQKVFGLDTNILTGPHPMFATAGGPFDGGSVYGASLREDGQRNRMGLSDYGVRYVRAMMKRGMLLDVEHMSDHTIDALIASGALPGEPRGPLWDALPPGQNGCELGSYSRRRSMRAGCFDDVYPIMSSHTSLRGQSMVPSQEQVRGVTTLPAVSAVKGYWAREFERTPRQVEFIRQSGGTIAPVVGHDPILRPQTVTRARGLDPVPAVSVFRGEDGTLRTDADRLDLNNCAGSSKSWITAYLYSVQKMRGRGVALSTDMAVVGSTGPRFDPPGTAAGLPKSCPSSYALFNPEFDILDIAHPREALAREMTRGREAEERLYPWQYQRAAQNDSTRIHYYDPSGFAEPPGYLVRHRAPDGRVFDFNTEGIKTYGSLPDLLQDAVNVGVAREDLAPLLHSAQDYVDMWRKAYRVTGCMRGPLYSRCAGRGLTPIAESVCANTCPDSPGRGSAVLPDGTPIFR